MDWRGTLDRCARLFECAAVTQLRSTSPGMTTLRVEGRPNAAA